MAHTKGPWRYDSPNCAILSETETRDYGYGDCFPVTVFTLYSACGGDDSQADIALACSAPDLLAALDKLTTAADDFAEHGKQRHWLALEAALKEAREVMAKAVQSEWSGSPCPDDPDNFWIDDETGDRVCAKTGERASPTG